MGPSLASLSRLDRVACALVVALVLGAFALWPLVSSTWPGLVVLASWTRTNAPPAERIDPWGRTFVIQGEPGGRFIYSRGADGADAGGVGGDDVVLFDQVGGRGPSGRAHAGAVLLSQSRGFLLVLAAFVAGTYFSARSMRPARSWRGELARSSALAVPVGVLTATMAFLASYTFLSTEAAALLQQRLVLPVRLALVGTVYGMAFLLILCVRLGRRGDAVRAPAPPRETLEDAAQRWLAEVLPPEADATPPPPPRSGRPGR